MSPEDLLDRVKKNLIINFSDDDNLLLSFIAAAINYAEGFQHLDVNHYANNECSETTKQGIVLLASHFYESRDGGTGGFFNNSPNGAQSSWEAVNSLLRLDRNWKV